MFPQDVGIYTGNANGHEKDTLYAIDVSRHLGQDAVYALSDVARMLSIQFTVQALLFFNDPLCDAFLSAEFFLMAMYVVLGVLVYWLIVRRIVRFR